MFCCFSVLFHLFLPFFFVFFLLLSSISICVFFLITYPFTLSGKAEIVSLLRYLENLLPFTLQQVRKHSSNSDIFYHSASFTSSSQIPLQILVIITTTHVLINRRKHKLVCPTRVAVKHDRSVAIAPSF